MTEKTILYPFSITAGNPAAYVQTLQLAREQAATVLCFSTVDSEEQLDSAYLQLLELNGYYQTQQNSWQSIDVNIKKAIKIGQWQTEIKQLLKEKAIDIVIGDIETEQLLQQIITAVVLENRPKIITY